MTDPARAHAKALGALLKAALPTTHDVYVGKVDKSDEDITYPYAVLWTPPAWRGVDSLAGYSAGTVSTRAQITGVGTTHDEALSVLDRCSAALHGVTPSISGRTCGQVRMTDDRPAPVALDPTTKTRDGHDVYFSSLLVELLSVAA